MRLFFDSIVQVSRLVRVGRFDDPADLESDLTTLARAYGTSDIGQIATAAFDSRTNGTGYFADVQDYYAETEAQLSGVHSPDGAVHFGLDWDGHYSREGFFGQARVLEEMIAKRSARDVLEVGSGKGFNSVYLARRNPEVRFTGVDLTEVHVRIASERGKGLSNLRFIRSDFHALEALPDDSIDLAFDVEAGCYSDTPQKLERFFSELHRVLRPGGLFVAFNYVRSDGFDGVAASAKVATELVERAWVIEGFHRESDWNQTAERAGLQLIERSDLRQAALPSIVRLYRQARAFYLLMAGPVKPLISWLVRRATHNAVSALMLPYTFGFGAVEYRMAVLENRS